MKLELWWNQLHEWLRPRYRRLKNGFREDSEVPHHVDYQLNPIHVGYCLQPIEEDSKMQPNDVAKQTAHEMFKGVHSRQRFWEMALLSAIMNPKLAWGSNEADYEHALILADKLTAEWTKRFHRKDAGESE
jgi:hypothetical protein